MPLLRKNARAARNIFGNGSGLGGRNREGTCVNGW